MVVVIDDEEGSAHRQYSYEKLLGIKTLSEKDQENISQGVDSVMERTRRLFYVCCSRAEEHLAIAMFTHDPDTALEQVTKSVLFEDSQVMNFNEVDAQGDAADELHKE